ncbi:uncharacterized protein MELLADRAFT_124225 [Melampsora larici-populina 98AG31]|uniref:Secreted protein n=1 Tax=Melampsora larici-populina (strain 98AG31 / pathotype 3-4-7) TaxID=747676 RepID=F4S5D9_MELLP|nr:uncharacterized protein MELLADRAFT_124225 [Melampsora larici-populina 98AG31]EGG00150.1 secreted protein [Melampsora larici-populina 98AG31]
MYSLQYLLIFIFTIIFTCEAASRQECSRFYGPNKYGGTFCQNSGGVVYGCNRPPSYLVTLNNCVPYHHNDIHKRTTYAKPSTQYCQTAERFRDDRRGTWFINCGMVVLDEQKKGMKLTTAFKCSDSGTILKVVEGCTPTGSDGVYHGIDYNFPQ